MIFSRNWKKRLRIYAIQPHLVSQNMDAASFTDVDTEGLAVQSPPSKAEIVAKLLATEDVSNDYGDAVATEIAPTETSFCKLSRPCKILLVFKGCCNYSILCESCCSHNWPTLFDQRHSVQKNFIEKIKVGFLNKKITFLHALATSGNSF